MHHLVPVLSIFVATSALAVTPDPTVVAAVPEPMGAVVFAAGAAMVLASIRRSHR